MRIAKIDKRKLVDDLNTLSEDYRVFVPVKEAKYYSFCELTDSVTPDFDYLNTRMSPKSLIYPQSEVMFEYSLDEAQEDHHILKEVPKDDTPRAVFGIRPCDVKAFLLVGKNFDNPQYKDPYWLMAFEATTFIGYACNDPCSSCFCTTAGCGPYHEEGLDVLIVDTGDTWLVKVLTDKGEKLATAAGWDTAAPDADEIIQELKQSAENKIVSHVATDRLKEQETIELYEASFWEDVSFSCINCGTCTFVCPTCWCFDIQDENRGKSGKRMRNWDSCMFPLFTLHGSGHNPRGSKLHRVRQRFMHKLKYYVDKYDEGIQCVGCGRCVRLCPVNIDIRRVCELMNSQSDADFCEVK